MGYASSFLAQWPQKRDGLSRARMRDAPAICEIYSRWVSARLGVRCRRPELLKFRAWISRGARTKTPASGLAGAASSLRLARSTHGLDARTVRFFDALGKAALGELAGFSQKSQADLCGLQHSRSPFHAEISRQSIETRRGGPFQLYVNYTYCPGLGRPLASALRPSSSHAAESS